LIVLAGQQPLEKLMLPFRLQKILIVNYFGDSRSFIKNKNGALLPNKKLETIKHHLLVLKLFRYYNVSRYEQMYKILLELSKKTYSYYNRWFGYILMLLQWHRWHARFWTWLREKLSQDECREWNLRMDWKNSIRLPMQIDLRIRTESSGLLNVSPDRKRIPIFFKDSKNAV